MIDPRTFWWLSRATGIVAWATLSLSVLWGLALTTRFLGRLPKPAWMLDIHRHFAVLASTLVGVHIGSLMLDGYARFSVGDVLIPMHTGWKPGPVAWGIVGLYLLLAVQGTSLARRRLPMKVWRALHFLSYPLWAVATAHFITAGTDAYSPAFAYTVIGTTVLISALTIGRVLSPRPARTPAAQPVPTPAPATSAPAPAATGPATRAEKIARARAVAAERAAARPSPEVNGPDREDLVVRARGAAAREVLARPPVDPDALVARARAAAAIELARRAANLGVAPPTPEASPAPVPATSLTRAEMIARARAVAAAQA
ncbi:MAG: ferric reductase-like transmembrane domain-containing protein [Actinomycetes bacterium]